MPRLVQCCPQCERASFEGKTHRNCKKPLSLDALFCLWPYKKIMRKAIISMKYKFAKEVAKELSSVFCDELIRVKPSYLKEKNTLIPVPISRSRKNWRGFNQTEVIGEIIAKKFSWEYIPDMIIKKSRTKPQTGLKLKERKSNIKGSFILNPKYKNKKYKQIIIFDDVWTTGSTIKEIGKVLKREKTSRVYGLTLAR